jgi:hypothetical protein
MLGQLFSRPSVTGAKNAIMNTVLVANAFVWYLYTFSFIGAVATTKNFTNEQFVGIIGIGFLWVVVSAVLGSMLIRKVKERTKFLRIWMAAGLFLSPIPLLMNISDYFGLIMVAAGVGAYFGLGLPTVMGYFSAASEPGNRAKLSGGVILIIGLGYPLLSLAGNDASLASLGLLLWRLSGLIMLAAFKPQEKIYDAMSTVTYKSIISNRTFLLYFIPWCMFALVNNLAFPVLDKFFTSSYVASSTMIETVLSGVFAIVFGFLADSQGRKRLALAGFALLGLGYGALGFFSQNPAGSVLYTAGWWFYTISDGIAWGAFSIIFLITVWGDIADKQNGEKFYIIGFLPYLLSNLMRYSIGTYVAETFTEATTVFSFASFFLFVAVLPLVYAPETLPEKVMQDKDLKSYVEKAKKKVEKDGGRDEIPENLFSDIEEKQAPVEENLKEDEEARRLAEKYY